MTAKVNYKEWQTKFNEQVSEQIQATDKVQLQAAKELLKRIEKRTPIGNPALWNYPAPAGYKPGTLRASWVMDVEGGQGKVVINISNDQPYAERVEFGWSTQAPEGMMRISNLEWASIVAKFSKG